MTGLPGEGRFVLLDRDGTLNAERDYLSDPGQLELLPGAAEGLRAMRALGLGLAVVTNQSGIARGYFDLAALERVHQQLAVLLGREGISLDGIFSCPHGPGDGCRCRKPAPGLVEQAAAALGFDPRLAFVIGDKRGDIELGQAVGATTILVRTGYGLQTLAEGKARPDHVVDGLAEAAAILARLVGGGGGSGA